MAHNQGMDMKQVNTTEDYELDVILDRYQWHKTDENRKILISHIDSLRDKLRKENKPLNRKAIYAYFDAKYPERVPE